MPLCDTSEFLSHRSALRRLFGSSILKIPESNGPKAMDPISSNQKIFNNKKFLIEKFSHQKSSRPKKALTREHF